MRPGGIPPEALGVDWHDLGIGEGGLPVHLPILLTAGGEGPAQPADARWSICWCRDPDCALTIALGQAMTIGRWVERRSQRDGAWASEGQEGPPVGS